MKVLHFILGKANKDRANGVNQVIAGLAKYSTRHGAQIRVIGKAGSVGHEGEVIARDGFSVEAYSRWGQSLRAALAEGIRWADVVHLHGVYSPWNLRVGRMCESLERPYIITLHNGLAPDLARQRSRIKKRIFHSLFQRRHLEHAAGVHVLTEEEATDLLACARPRNMFCIPNGVDLEDYPRSDARRPVSPGPLTFGYRGRLSEEKNLDALCRAFAQVNEDRSMRLRLAGPASDYGSALLDKYGRHGIEWVGPRFGGDKTEFIRSVDLFVHPSRCDVFSIAAMEVLAIGTPLLITRTSKVSYFQNAGAFSMCEPTIFGLVRGMRRVLAQRDAWPAMAANGRRLVEEQLNWSVAAQALLREYHRVGQGE